MYVFIRCLLCLFVYLFEHKDVSAKEFNSLIVESKLMIAYLLIAA